MSEHTDETIIRQLRETVERQAEDSRKLADRCEIVSGERRLLAERLNSMAEELDRVSHQNAERGKRIEQLDREIVTLESELAELRRLVQAFGETGQSLTWGDLVEAVGDCRDYNRRKASQCPTSDT